MKTAAAAAWILTALAWLFYVIPGENDAAAPITALLLVPGSPSAWRCSAGG